MKIPGTVSIVTGGASGLGESTVRELAGEGSKVMIADLNDERGKEIVDELTKKG
jgi:NAD(P)-dependent dehydrogenase (short-subunit alcohol dehydrogenase family)